MSRSVPISNNLDRLLKNRKRVKMPFFLSDFPQFFVFLLVSYCGIFFVTYSIFSSTHPTTSFVIARFWLQRCVGIVNCAAFISFWVQAHGLIGEKGIKPIKQQLADVDQLNAAGNLSVSKYEYHPTLFWISSSDKFLHFICFLGVLSSTTIISPCYISTTPFFILCAICYGSIKTVGAEFMQLQWDSMLIEVNVICLWFELDALIMSRTGSDIWLSDSYSSRIGMIMLYWLHYRLMISAGFVKLSSGCPKWRDGTAMKYHFWTQPIPSPTSILAWKYGLANVVSTYGSIFSEIILPFAIFFIPSRICRLIACFNTVGLMFLIFATGNFGFFNVLTAVLGISCIDDGLWPNFMNGVHSFLGFSADEHGDFNINIVFHYEIVEVFTTVISFLWFVMILIVSLRSLWHITYRKLPITGSFRLFVLKISMWSIVNAYGLFARMTTFRHELIFQGTVCEDYESEECEWKTYEFKYKPGDINKRPPFAVCHLPRLDWRLWFLPLRKYNKYNDGWCVIFVKKMIKNGKDCPTLNLLGYNPFVSQAGTPIKAVRILQYEYRFVNDFVDDEFGAVALNLHGDELNWESGKWWIRRYLQCQYMPTMTREDVFNENELNRMRIRNIVNAVRSVRKNERKKKIKKENDNEEIEEDDGSEERNEYQCLNDKEVPVVNEIQENENKHKNVKKVKKSEIESMESLLNSTIKESKPIATD